MQLDLIYKDRDTEQDNAKSEKDHSAFTEAPDEEEYAFRLFSTRSGQSQASKNQPPKIRIRSPETVSCDPGFVQSWRPEGYYFSKHSDTLREQYKAIAIEGEDVLNEAQAKWVRELHDRTVVMFTPLLTADLLAGLRTTMASHYSVYKAIQAVKRDDDRCTSRGDWEAETKWQEEKNFHQGEDAGPERQRGEVEAGRIPQK